MAPQKIHLPFSLPHTPSDAKRPEHGCKDIGFAVGNDNFRGCGHRWCYFGDALLAFHPCRPWPMPGL